MQESRLVGKELEILEYIAMNGPCTNYQLRGSKAELRKTKKRWSSRTIWKQIPRMEKDGLIARIGSEYEATDRGFFELAHHLAGESASACKKLVKVAMEKFPNGHTAKVFSWVIAAKPLGKEGQLRVFREWCQKVDGILQGKVPPNCHFGMEITTNQAGQLSLRASDGINFKSLRPKG